MSKCDAPATHRNREPILEVLARWLTTPTRVLEIASGTGQHAVFFAEHLPSVTWQPSDGDPSSLPSIEGWTTEAGLGNVEKPLRLDAASDSWPIESGAVDAIFNANMIHISPWTVGLGLFRGAGRILEPDGLIFLYGPFKVGGEHTAPSNVSFDASLKERDASWGIRDFEEVLATAERAGFAFCESNDLPANNKLIVFRKNESRQSAGLLGR